MSPATPPRPDFNIHRDIPGVLYPVYFRYAQYKNGDYAHRIVELLDGTHVKSKKAQVRFWDFV